MPRLAIRVDHNTPVGRVYCELLETARENLVDVFAGKFSVVTYGVARRMTTDRNWRNIINDEELREHSVSVIGQALEQTYPIHYNVAETVNAAVEALTLFLRAREGLRGV